MAWLNTTKSGVAVPYAKRIKLTLDGSKIEEDLTDFPVLVKLSDESGILNTDVTDVFDDLDTGLHIDSYTKLLLHMDDVGLTDSSPVPKAVTKYANVTRSSTQSKFGGYSAYFDGSDDYLTSSSSDYSIATSEDYTIDFWCYPTKVFSSYTCLFSIGGYSNLYLRINPSGRLELCINSGVRFGCSVQFPANIWSHIALVRESSVLKLYVNGISKFTYSYSSSISATDLKIGRDYKDPGYFKGFIDEFRIVRGLAIWTSNFTPPNQAYYNAINDARKLAITSSDGETQQYVEIESWDAVSKEAWLWTKCPTLASGVNTDLYLYYDKDAADNDTYVGETGSLAATNVWDDNFVGVWHMGQDPSGGAGCIKDSTSLSKDLTSGGGMTASDIVDGMIGKAIDFDGVDDYLTIASDASFDVISFTIESTLNLVDTGDIQTIFQYGDSESTVNYRWFNNLFQIGYSSNSWETVIMSSTPPYVTDVYLSVIKNGQNISFFMNSFYNGGGDLVNTARVGTRPVFISKCEYGSTDYYFLKGTQSELRFSSVVRSPEWIKATYYSNWDDLITYRIYHGYIDGYIYENETPVCRTVNLHSRPYGVLVDSTTSSIMNGYYYLETTFSGSHYIVVIDDDAGDVYNDLIAGRLYPTEII